MIAACETQESAPFGRDYVRLHPGQFQLQVQNNLHRDHGLPLFKSFRDILSLRDYDKKEQWTLASHGDKAKSFDEELYVSGNTVVWSRGGTSDSRSVVKTFTVDTPVIQALWADFVLPEKDVPSDVQPSLDAVGVVEHGICVVESSNLRFFKDKGGEHVAALPFQVSHACAIKNGILFERTVTHSELTAPKKNTPNQTVVFSMLHPLDEVAPVITKTQTGGNPPKIRYLNDNSMQIIFTSADPSLAVTYDRMLGLHSVWRVRRARSEECYAVSNLWDSSFNNNNQFSTTPMMGPNQSSGSHSRLLSNLSLHSPSISLHSPSISPMRSFSGRIVSPAGVSRSVSPSQSQMAAVSRSQSPALTGSVHRFHSAGSMNRSPAALLRTASGSQNLSVAGNESYSEWVEPLQPEVCLEHLWTETAPPIRDGSLGKASKAFLSADFCGQHFLCFMVPYRQQLRCIKFEESNDLTQLIFGTQTVIAAKDATPVEGLSLLVVLETSGFLVIYSGTTKINHLHVPLMPALGASGSMSMLRAVTPINSPNPGGVFTSSRPPSAMDARFDEEMTHISPVQTNFDDSSQFEGSLGDMVPQGYPSIQSLRDNVGNRFTIELMSGHMFRTSMPPLTSSPGIELCLKALKHLLPKDVAMGMLGRWYTRRNTPGGLGTQSEWSAFTACLLTAMGYDTSKLALTRTHEVDLSLSPVLSAKRPKPSDQGSEEDWEQMLASNHHRCVRESYGGVMGLSPCPALCDSSTYSRPCTLDTSCPLFLYCPAVMLALHLVYEEMKLNILLHEELDQLVPLLFQITRDLKCSSYVDYYCRDFPHLFTIVDDVSQVTEEHLEKMQYPAVFPSQVPSVCLWIHQKLRGRATPPIVYIPFCTNNIKNIITLYSLLLYPDLTAEQAMDKCLRKISPAGHRAPTADVSLSHSFQVSPVTAAAERVVLSMTELGMLEQTLERLPVGVALPLRDAIFHCRCCPPSDWPEAAYTLIGREDLARLKSMQGLRPRSAPSVFNCQPQAHGKTSRDEEDGMETLEDQVLKLRFSEDLRVQEARRLLQSSKPVRVALTQRPEVSDHDFIEEQERHLYSLCIRTMALPTGRGIFSLCTIQPVPTEAMPIPKLCLTGRAPPRNTTVDLTHIDTPPNMAAWPHFHNGVAAGLRIAHSSQVESTWIIFNKPKSNELTNEYAGFLMALGLNGHLGNLHTLNVHDYLSKGHEMTTVGLLLGLCANHRGTMDLATTRMLSIHVSALLPPTSTELNIPHNVQVAAVLGVGLLYQGTGHLHMAEVLLSEIGRPPGPEMENSTDRESYSLAAGLALGLIMFGKGKDAVGLSDHNMADILCHFMVGGHKRPLPMQYRERYKTPSYLIWEGDCVNVDVTAPGATLALGMLFFNTGNSAIAEWLRAPDTQFMLDQVRLDFLLLRTLSRGLVLWDSIQPTMEWVESNLPEILVKFAFKKGEVEDPDGDDVVDFETIGFIGSLLPVVVMAIIYPYSQAYCNIVVGSCMALGLKFAGTANQLAFTTLMDCLNRSLQILSSASLCDQAGRSTVENCMPVILVSLGMVMAGTGNLEVLRVCRMLRKRIGPQFSSVVYGSHMAISIAIGLLFMGAGRYTLGTKPEDIGVLLCAFFPKYPHHSNDNRYHLQAFRHLYVLAAEPRVVIPRDVDTGLVCYVPLQVRFKDCKDYSNVAYNCLAPCILPELDRLLEIKVLGPRYWPIVFHADKNWDILKHLLKNSSSLYVKQRAGQLSYNEDPQGYRSMLAKSLTKDHSCHYLNKPDVIKSFTSDPRIIALAEYFLNSKSQQNHVAIQELAAVLYECITKEKPEAISSHFVLEQLLHQSQSGPPSGGIWQLKLMLAYYKSAMRLPAPPKDVPTSASSSTLMDVEFLLSLKLHLENALDAWLKDNMALLVTYLSQKPVPREAMNGEEKSYLSQFLTWFDIPLPQHLTSVNVQGSPTLPVLCQQLPGLSIATVMRILSAWQATK